MTAELTFIVFDSSARVGVEGTCLGGTASGDVAGDIPGFEKDRVGGRCTDCTGMVGDVNIFLMDPDHAEDYVAIAGVDDSTPRASAAIVEAAADTTAGAGSSRRRTEAVGDGGNRCGCAEIMVMIAEKGARRQGLAVQAVVCMMKYGESPPES